MSTNITAVIVTFVSAVALVQEESVLTVVQLFWINIIMDTFAALALATNPASESQCPPPNRLSQCHSPLIGTPKRALISVLIA
jgi:magnesium-transporting ATPase (P-type)